MAAALTLLLIGSLLQGGLGRVFKAVMPTTITVLRGSCVTIPCSFDIRDDHDPYFDHTCRALWKNSQHVVLFDSSDPQKNQNTMNGNFREKDCTVTLNNIYSSDYYYFRLECDNPLKYNFYWISITVTGDPPSPTVTPATLTVKEGDSVKLTCSAPVPCLSHPPTLTWTSGLGDGVETLKENQDKTKVKTSVVTFTASYSHHGKAISCTATYRKQDGITRTATSSPSRVHVSCDPPSPTVTPATLTVKEGDSVKLTCSAPVPCLSHPPTLTWTSGLGNSMEILEDNQDKTKVKTSVVTFTASYSHHHRKAISCTATFSTKSATSPTSTVYVLYPPKQTTVSVKPTGPVPEGQTVTLTCRSTANPPVSNYTWYRTDGGQDIIIGTGDVLNINAPKDPFFCKAENAVGAQRSNINHIDVQYPPKETTVSVQPSGPVPEGQTVTLTCKSTAHPQVTSYTWYRTDGDQDTIIGTGAVLKIKAPKYKFFCKAENAVGAGQSNINHINVQFAPQILPSSVCTKASAQLTCSCRTVGNPSPSLQWYLDELPINHSDRFVVSNGNLSSVITVNQPWEKEASTLLCHSNNSLESASQRFYIISLQDSESAVTLPVFITTVVVLVCALLVLVCALLFVKRSQKTDRELLKSQTTSDTSTVTMSQLLTGGARNEARNAAEEDIYVNSKALKQDVLEPAAVSDPNNANLPSSGPNNVEEAGKSSEKGNEVIYTAVKWKKKKKEEDSVEMHQSDAGKQSEYAEVTFKKRSAVKE